MPKNPCAIQKRVKFSASWRRRAAYAGLDEHKSWKDRAIRLPSDHFANPSDEGLHRKRSSEILFFRFTRDSVGTAPGYPNT